MHIPYLALQHTTEHCSRWQGCRPAHTLTSPERCAHPPAGRALCHCASQSWPLSSSFERKENRKETLKPLSSVWKWPKTSVTLSNNWNQCEMNLFVCWTCFVTESAVQNNGAAWNFTMLWSTRWVIVLMTETACPHRLKTVD